MRYSSRYRPCHSVWSDADAETLRKAVLAVDPNATFEDGNVGYSYPYGQEDLFCMVANYIPLPDDCINTAQAAMEILREHNMDIRDISARMRDYDGDGYLEGIAENVRGILEECLTHYVLEEHPEQKKLFKHINFRKYKKM